MYMRKYISTLVLFLLTSFPLFSQNLVRNGDFKKYEPLTGRCADWVYIAHNEVVEEGPGVTPVLRVASYYRSSDGSWKGNAIIEIPEIPAGSYRFRLKTRGSANKIYFFLNSARRKFTICRDCHKNRMKSMGNGWKSGEYKVTFSKNMQKVKLILDFFFLHPGEYEYIADVQLVKE